MAVEVGESTLKITYEAVFDEHPIMGPVDAQHYIRLVIEVFNSGFCLEPALAPAFVELSEALIDKARANREPELAYMAVGVVAICAIWVTISSAGTAAPAVATALGVMVTWLAVEE